MKQTTFFLFLFALCFIACTKVQQVNPTADGTRSSAAKSQNPNGGGSNPNPMACSLPAPTGLVVTSPYSAGTLQKLDIRWNTVPTAVSYDVRVIAVGSGATIYYANVLQAGGTMQQHLTTNVFSAFVAYQVQITSKCASGNGGMGTQGIIITGGPVASVQDDLEKPSGPNAPIYQSTLKSIESASISFVDCVSGQGSFAPFNTLGVCTSIPTPTPKFANLTSYCANCTTNIPVNIKLNVPAAAAGDFIAICEYPSSINCSPYMSGNSWTANNNWKVQRFITDQSICIPVIKSNSKKYRIRLYTNGLLSSMTYPPQGAQYNQVQISCSFTN